MSARELSSDWGEFRVFSISEKGEATEHSRGLVFVEHRVAVEEIDGHARVSIRRTSLVRV